MTNTKKLARLSGSNPKTQRDLIARLELLGCEVTNGGKHLRISLNGSLRVTMPSTPSCSRSLLNTVRDLRHAGLDVRSMSITDARLVG